MTGKDPDTLPPDVAVKADVVAWVGKLDDAVEDLYRQIDRLIGGEVKDGTGREPSGVSRPAQRRQ